MIFDSKRNHCNSNHFHSPEEPSDEFESSDEFELSYSSDESHGSDSGLHWSGGMHTLQSFLK